MRKAIPYLLLLLCLPSLAMAPGQADTVSPVFRPGKDYALFFAVNQYKYIADLNNPIQNARDIAREMEQSYGFQVEIIENPTIDQIDQKIVEYKHRFSDGTYAADGQLFIYFSGHGIKEDANGYFMANDSDPARPQRSAMEYDYYRSQIDQINCRHILVAIDACHSATFDPSYGSRNDGRRFQRKGEEQFDRILANHEAYKARCFWTSDGVGEQTPDRSNFAYHLLEGLRSRKYTASYMRSSELFSVYLEKASPKPGGGRFGEDEPNSCFLFFPSAIDLKPSPNEEDVQEPIVHNCNNLFILERDLITIPSGKFFIGRKEEEIDFLTKEFFGSEPSWFYDDLPFDTVYIESYKISKFEISVEQYKQFLECFNHKEPVDWKSQIEKGLKKPVTNINWDDAREFCEWLSKETGRRFKLPTDEQWEVAAQGRKREFFPWGGDTPNSDRVGFAQAYYQDIESFSYDKSEFGVCNMAGNVSEWCFSSCKGYKSVRGGNWNNRTAENLRCSHRRCLPPQTTSNEIGFRVVLAD